MSGNDWPVLPVKRLAEVWLGKMIQNEAKSAKDVQAPYLRAAHVQPNGHIIDVDSKTMWFGRSEIDRHDLRPGDVVVVEGGAGYGRSAVVHGDFSGWGFQNSIIRLRPRPGLGHGRFLDYALQSAQGTGQVAVACYLATIPHFTAEKLAALALPAPPAAEQRAIADYLERETAQIDALIGKQERLINTLRERRAAVMDRVVWLGLDGGELASTGVDAAPSAPSHWPRRRNKNLLRERTTLSLSGSEKLLSVSHLTGVTPRSDKNVTMFEAESLDGHRIALVGDLVINTMWAWMGALGVSRDDGIVSPAYGVYQALDPGSFEPRYFDSLYRSKPYVIEMMRHSRGMWTSRLRLYPESFLRLPVVVPPIDEQLRIADYLDEQTARIDLLISKAERFIELAKERRSALITAAVTGQIDVREAVAS